MKDFFAIKFCKQDQMKKSNNVSFSYRILFEVIIDNNYLKRNIWGKFYLFLSKKYFWRHCQLLCSNHIFLQFCKYCFAFIIFIVVIQIFLKQVILLCFFISSIPTSIYFSYSEQIMISSSSFMLRDTHNCKYFQ